MHNKCILQKIIFPNLSFPIPNELYYRSCDRLKWNADDSLCLRKGYRVCFDTYFNSFSLEKWIRYTFIERVFIKIICKGDLVINLFSLKKKNGKVVREKLSSLKVSSNDYKEYVLYYPSIDNDELLFFSLKAHSESDVKGMYYCGESDVRPRILNIAVGFCTYKREEYITSNLFSIEKSIIQNNNSLLYNKLHVYVSDNGETLTTSDFDSRFIHVFPNLNYGGAGGFTRVIIEAMILSKRDHDYIILMDDDLILDCRILERTYCFLALLKPDYYHSMMGGAIMSQQEPWLQVENGAYCDEKAIRHKVHGLLDMRRRECLLDNQKEGGANYNGWFFCAIPAVVTTKNNLPLPIFIHFDDTDYGVRNEKYPLLTLPGICIWHPNLIGKDPMWMTYYNMRNELIHHSYRESKASYEEIAAGIVKQAMDKLRTFRYEEVSLLCRAVADFYRGPDVFMKLDPKVLHETLAENRYKRKKITYKDIIIYKCYRAIKRRLSLPCYSILIVDRQSMTGYYLQYNKKKEIEGEQRIRETMQIVREKHVEVWTQWGMSYKVMISLEFWMQYLNLER